MHQNTGFKFRLFKFSNYISKGEYGILAFDELGRVWPEGGDSNVRHHGYVAGAWLSPFNELSTYVDRYARYPLPLK